jgi:hypothetical protein
VGANPGYQSDFKNQMTATIAINTSAMIICSGLLMLGPPPPPALTMLEF